MELPAGVVAIDDSDILVDARRAALTQKQAPKQTVQESHLGQGLHTLEVGDRKVLQTKHGELQIAMDARHAQAESPSNNKSNADRPHWERNAENLIDIPGDGTPDR